MMPVPGSSEGQPGTVPCGKEYPLCVCTEWPLPILQPHSTRHWSLLVSMDGIFWIALVWHIYTQIRAEKG